MSGSFQRSVLSLAAPGWFCSRSRGLKTPRHRTTSPCCTRLPGGETQRGWGGQRPPAPVMARTPPPILHPPVGTLSLMGHCTFWRMFSPNLRLARGPPRGKSLRGTLRFLYLWQEAFIQRGSPVGEENLVEKPGCALSSWVGWWGDNVPGSQAVGTPVAAGDGRASHGGDDIPLWLRERFGVRSVWVWIPGPLAGWMISGRSPDLSWPCFRI